MCVCTSRPFLGETYGTNRRVARLLTRRIYPVFHVIPHTLGMTAQAYELPHKALKYPELRLSAVVTIEDFQRTGSGLFLKTSSRHYFTRVRFLIGFVR